MCSIWGKYLATPKCIRVDVNIKKWFEKCKGRRALRTAVGINHWREAGRSYSHYTRERRLTTEEIELQLGASQDTAYSLVFDIFGYRKISAKWVHKHLGEGYRRNLQDICCSLLRYNREGDNFLNGIIPGIETRIHHYETETKWQSMELKHTSSSSSKIFKSLSSARRFFLTVHWDSQRPILEHLMERGTMVESVNYCC